MLSECDVQGPQSANELSAFSMRDFLSIQPSEINSKPELMLPISTAARMTLHLVLLPLMLAVSVASTQQCASSVGSRLDLSIHGHKNASGHWIITVDTRRLLTTEKQWELTVNVHQERISCGSNETEQLVSVTYVYPPSHDFPVSTGIERTAPSSTTSAPSATATPATQTTTKPSTTTRTKSCPPGYQHLVPGINCYKIYRHPDEYKSWSDARGVCRREGGDLVVVESEREKKEVFVPLIKSAKLDNGPWVGVYFPQGGDGWMSVKGEAVLSTWWRPTEPDSDADRKCADASTITGLLANYNCASQRPFMCEIPL